MTELYTENAGNLQSGIALGFQRGGVDFQLGAVDGVIDFGEVFPVNLLVSEADAEYLRTISNHKSSLVVHTNGVDVLPSVKKEYDP